jgi:hypothetical protein
MTAASNMDGLIERCALREILASLYAECRTRHEPIRPEKIKCSA